MDVDVEAMLEAPYQEKRVKYIKIDNFIFTNMRIWQDESHNGHRDHDHREPDPREHDRRDYRDYRDDEHR